MPRLGERVKEWNLMKCVVSTSVGGATLPEQLGKA